MIKLMKKVLKYIEPRITLYLFLTLLFIICASIFTSVIPLLLRKIIDQLNVAADHHAVLSLFFIYAIALILERFFNEIQFLSYPNWENGILRNAYKHIFESLFNNMPDYFKNRLYGTITSQIFQAISGLDALMFDIIFKVFPILINFILMLVTIVFALNSITALIVGAGAITYFVVMYRLNNKLVNHQIALRNSHLHAQGVTSDLIYSWKDIKLTNAHVYAKNIINESTKEILNKSSTFYYKRSIYGFIQSMVVCAVFITSNYYEITRYLNGSTTIGGLVLLNNYLLLIMRPLESFSLILRGLSRSCSDFNAIDEIIDFDKEELQHNDELLQVNSIHLANIRIDNVINDISLNIYKGDKIAIIGQSGVGKSSLFNILTGLRSDYAGKIFINDDISKPIVPSVLRSHIAYCNADARLITDTLFNNMCLGKNIDVQSLINISSLQNKITQLQYGANSIISENSTSLSTGEIQRIKIARTVGLDKSFEFYDESSSAFDDNLSEEIFKNLLQRKDKAVIFITHNKKFLNLFDKVYIMKNDGLFACMEY